MIEIDNNDQRNDEPLLSGDDNFFSDAERSGFGDDAESFGLGAPSPASATGEFSPKEASPKFAANEPEMEGVAVESSPLKREKQETQEEEQSQKEQPQAEKLPEEKAQEPVAMNAVSAAEDTASDVHEDTENSKGFEENFDDIRASAETKARKVISIPDAASQRKADAERAANDKARLAEELKRKKQSRASILTAVALGVLLGALVGLGYVFARQTPLGKAVQTLWATLNGTSSARAEHQSFTASSGSDENVLDVARVAKPDQNNAQQSAIAQGETAQNETAQTSANQTGAENASGGIEKFSAAPSSPASPAISSDSTTPKKQSAERASASDGKQERSSPKESPPPTQPAKEQSAKEQSVKGQSAVSRSAQRDKTVAPPKPLKAPPASVMARNTKRIETGVFAIQVYATPSIADAEDWVERLRRRGMVNPVLSSQVVRGQIMYRVRFGLYNSLQEAERDAARFGYRDSWVVRLR
jgi:cell division septation protein DedD